MSKTQPEIAKAILERRNRLTHVIMPGEITAQIGPDGVAEALKQRWLVPDADSGFLCASNELAVVEAMRKIAEMKPEAYTPEAIPVSEGHDFSLLHTKRRSIVEIAAPMTGGASPGLSTVGQPPQPPQPPQSGQSGGYAVGTPVTVARQGKSSQGVIEKMMPDGRFQIGFGADQQRPQGDNVFSKEEVSVTPTGPQRVPGTTNAPTNVPR